MIDWRARANALDVDLGALYAEACQLAQKPFWVVDDGQVHGFDSKPEAVQFCIDHRIPALHVNPHPGRPRAPHEIHELEI